MKKRRVVSSVKLIHQSNNHMDTNRLSKELREIASDKASGVSVELVGDSLAHMHGTITGTNTSLSLLSLSCLTCKSFPRDSGESGLFLPRFGVYVFVLSSDQHLFYIP